MCHQDNSDVNKTWQRASTSFEYCARFSVRSKWAVIVTREQVPAIGQTISGFKKRAVSICGMKWPTSRVLLDWLPLNSNTTAFLQVKVSWEWERCFWWICGSHSASWLLLQFWLHMLTRLHDKHWYLWKREAHYCGCSWRIDLNIRNVQAIRLMSGLR